jgi:hypothetical protein
LVVVVHNYIVVNNYFRVEELSDITRCSFIVVGYSFAVSRPPAAWALRLLILRLGFAEALADEGELVGQVLREGAVDHGRRLDAVHGRTHPNRALGDVRGLEDHPAPLSTVGHGRTPRSNMKHTRGHAVSIG